MLRSLVTRILSYSFIALLRFLETSLKNVTLLLSIRGLYANIRNHFLFEIVSSKEKVKSHLII